MPRFYRDQPDAEPVLEHRTGNRADLTVQPTRPLPVVAETEAPSPATVAEDLAELEDFEDDES